MSDKMMRRVVADMGRASRDARRKKYASSRGEAAVAPVQVDETIESSNVSPEELEQILAGAK